MLFIVGGVLVALALGVVFGDDETAEVAPQTQSIDLSVKRPLNQLTRMAIIPCTTNGVVSPDYLL